MDAKDLTVTETLFEEDNRGYKRVEVQTPDDEVVYTLKLNLGWSTSNFHVESGAGRGAWEGVPGRFDFILAYECEGESTGFGFDLPVE